MCGIWGFSGRKDRKADPRKLLILGLYNRSRGTDSCGYYYNGNVVKGIDKLSDFKDFIVENKFVPGDLPFENVMCHARKSTYGQHTKENAHPHVIENYVQTHNGTLKNHFALCTKHGIDHKSIYLDSIALAHIIQKDGFSVLNEYEGYAALTMIFMDDPASMYLYHGASREKKDGDLYEERPLFYLSTAEGLYYSSMEESLKIINTGKNIVKKLPHNIVYKVQFGEIVEKVYNVERDERNVTTTYVTVYPKVTTTYGRSSSTADGAFNYRDFGKKNINAHQKVIGFAKEDNDRGLILRETTPPEQQTQSIYFRYGRHHRCKYGLYDGTYGQREVLLHGVYCIDREGDILDRPEDSKNKSEYYYFIRGIMLKDKESYETCLANFEQWKDLRYNVSTTLSEFSKYPITSYFDEARSIENTIRNMWFHNRVRYDGTFEVKFSRRSYEVKAGLLHNVKHPKGTNEAICKTQALHEHRKVYVDNQLQDDEVTYKHILQLVVDSSDKVLVEDDIKNLPEAFLMFIEMYAEEESQTSLTERQSFNEGVILLQLLLSQSKTFAEYLKENYETPDYLNLDLIKKWFKDYLPEDIYKMPNRYIMQPFSIVPEQEDENAVKDLLDTLNKETTYKQLLDATKPKEEMKNNNIVDAEIIEEDNLISEAEKREALEKIKNVENQFIQLSALADELQSLNTCDEAQDTALALYVAIDKYKDALKTK